MKIRSIYDITRNKDRLSNAIPELKEKLEEEISKLPPEIRNGRQFRKIMSIHNQLSKNQGILSVINEMKEETINIDNERLGL